MRGVQLQLLFHQQVEGVMEVLLIITTVQILLLQVQGPQDHAVAALELCVGHSVEILMELCVGHSVEILMELCVGHSVEILMELCVGHSVEILMELCVGHSVEILMELCGGHSVEILMELCVGHSVEILMELCVGHSVEILMELCGGHSHTYQHIPPYKTTYIPCTKRVHQACQLVHLNKKKRGKLYPDAHVTRHYPTHLSIKRVSVHTNINK